MERYDRGNRRFSSNQTEERGDQLDSSLNQTTQQQPRYTPQRESRMSFEEAQFALNADAFNAYADEAPVNNEQQIVDMKMEADKRLSKIRSATLATRHFGTMQSATSRQMYRPNTRGTRESFVNLLRKHYEKDTPAKAIMPWSTDSGMRNLPDRIFSHADRQRDEIKKAELRIAPPPAKTIAKEDIDAGLLEMYTLPGSSGYAQSDSYGAAAQDARDAYENTIPPQALDSDPYMIPGVPATQEE